LIRAARSAGGAAVFFLGVSLVMTWPLAGGLTRDIPSDYGDPLYAAWAIAWVSHQIGRVLTGDLSVLAHFWDANQLAPEPSTLALSDHFVAQTLPVAPVYWVTGNPILTLNLAYLLAFTLSGVGVYLLARELTGSAPAALVAGLILPFNEFMLRFELAHLQVISTGWMPLSLYALRRYFVTGSRGALAGAAACLVMSNLSAGYYLLMFPPFVALYCAWEIAARRLWTAPARLIELGVAACVVGAVTAPFVWPYVEVQQRYAFSRTVAETTAMAATVDAYVASVRRLGIAYALAAIGAISGALHLVRGARSLAGERVPLSGFAVVATLLAFWLSLGPTPTWGGQTYPALGLYGWLQDFMPGMNAVRVSSRFASIFLLFLAVLAGMGAARVVRRGHWASVLGVLLLGAALLAANVRRPFPTNTELAPTDQALRPPPSYLRPAPSSPTVYQYVEKLEGPVLVAEFPFSDLWYSSRYLFFSTFHWQRTLNGFTSVFPPTFVERTKWLINPSRTPEEAWQELTSAGASHAILHMSAWDEATGQRMVEFLESRGATLLARLDGALVYELPR
jgi:hypothetical protein